MSPRGFVALLAVTILVVIGAIFVAVQPTLSGVRPIAGEPMFPALSQNLAEASKVTVETPQYAVTWERRGDAWVSPERGDFAARKNAAPDLVLGLSRMTKVEAKTAKPDWYQYIRVGDPSATPPTGVARVTVTSASGQPLADVILGARSFGIAASHSRGGMFVRGPNDAQSWLVEGSASVPADLSEWFDTIVDIPGATVTDIAILVGDKTLLKASKTDAANGVYTIASLDPAEAPADSVANSNSLRSVASAIVGIRAADVRAADSVPAAADARTMRFTTTSGLVLDVLASKEADGVWASFKASAPEGSDGAAMAVDINTRTAGWAFRLDESHGSRLTQPVANLVQQPAAPAPDGVAPIPLDPSGMPILNLGPPG
jgi:hypothetical protein